MGSVPTPAVCSQMTLVSVCDDSVPQSPHPHKGHDNSAYLLVFPCGLTVSLWSLRTFWHVVILKPNSLKEMP